MSKLLPGDRVTVRAIKQPRRNDLVYEATCISDDGDHIALHAKRTLPTVSIGPTFFEMGDLFEEHYWRTRWYGVLQVANAKGAIKGWYGNVSCPAKIVGNEIQTRDLELDLWVPADGSAPVRLDEGDFLVSGLSEEEPEVAKQALRSLQELEEFVLKGGLSLLFKQAPNPSIERTPSFPRIS